MLKEDPVLENTSIPEYFMELVTDAIKRQNLETDETTEFYIVNLLTEFSRTENFYTSREGHFIEEPLALIFIKALESGIEERKILLRKIGDSSLFLTGFFSDSLKRRVVDLDYYISMGENAYAQLSYLTEGRAKKNHLSNMFHELSENFTPFMDILSEVSERSSLNSLDDILKLYEKWIKTKEERYAGLLREKGVLPLQERLGIYTTH